MERQRTIVHAGIDAQELPATKETFDTDEWRARMKEQLGAGLAGLGDLAPAVPPCRGAVRIDRASVGDGADSCKRQAQGPPDDCYSRKTPSRTPARPLWLTDRLPITNPLL